MGKSTKKYIGVAVIFVYLMMIPTFIAAVDINLNDKIVNSLFDITKDYDYHANIEREVCTFRVESVITDPAESNEALSFNGYADAVSPADWNCAIVNSNATGTLAYGSYILKTESPLVWTEMGTSNYASHTIGSQASLVFEHRSRNSYKDAAGRGQIARADKNITEASIGEVEFDIMPWLNITKSTKEPKAKFHFELDDWYDNSQSIHLVFQTQNSSLTNYTTNVYAYELGANGQKNVLTKIFTGADGYFNWMHVKLFYDCYNDVYNITMYQYQMDLAQSGYLVSPTSIVIRGQQHTTDVRDFQLKGKRIAPSHTVSSLDFWLESDADDNYPSLTSVSKVFIDGVRFKAYKIPGVYGDISYENGTIRVDNQTSGGGFNYMNNSLITAYQPPRYPAFDANYYIGYSDAYIKNYLNPGMLTAFRQTPSWVFNIPVVVTANHSVNVASIVNALNSGSLIETQGVNQPSKDSFYLKDTKNAFAAQFFVYNASESKEKEYSYVFSARNTASVIKIKYYSLVSTAGILTSFELFENKDEDVPLVRVVNGWGEQKRTLDSFQPILFLMMSMISAIIVVIAIKRKKNYV